MNSKIFAACIPAFLLCASAFAADAPRNKVIDSYDSLDPKSNTLWELKAKVVTTPDPAHKKVLELTADFAKPGTWPTLRKALLPGTIDPKRYKALRFFYKSDTETGMNVSLRAGSSTPEGREIAYGFDLKGAPQWQEAVIPFSDFSTWRQKVWVKGEAKEFPAGLKILPKEFALLKSLHFVFSIQNRGTSSTGTMLIDGVELVAQ